MRVEKIDFYLDPASFAPMKRVVVVVPVEALTDDEKILPQPEYERAVGKRFLDAMVDYQNNEQTKYTPSTTNGAAAPKTAD